jgi:CubicO group peptidase (beta-lactamase class C family)
MKRFLVLLLCILCVSGVNGEGNVFPGATWETREPAEVGLARDKLDALRELVGGRGCVVRHGCMVYSWGDQTKSSDVASAFKPVLSTLLLMAVQESRLKSVDDPVAEFEPRLKTLNNGKDAAITWRHLASQTSGYGLAEPPGAAYSYNDFALTLYYEVLTQKVFGTNGTDVLRRRLAEPLQFEDAYTFNAFRRPDRDGRLALSVRDFARLGLLYLRNGQWRDKQLIKPDFIQMAINSPIPAATSLTSGREADMLPGQHSIGGSRNITPVGPGYYSFNWWLNRTNKTGQRLYVDAPPDTYVASGHGGKRTLWIIPSLDLIVCWNDSPIDDHDASPGNPSTKCNQAARLMVEAVSDHKQAAETPKTALAVEDPRFTLNGKRVFLYGISYYGALAAKDEFIRLDLDDMQRLGLNWIRVWANWTGFGADAAAVDGEGRPIPSGIERLKKLVAECDRRGMVVDVTFSRGNGITGPPRLLTLDAHSRAVETVVTALQPWRNWYLDLSNERNVRDKRFTSISDLKALRDVARRLNPQLLITASHAGDISREELREYLQVVGVDFISPHRPRDAGSPSQTAAKTRQYLAWSKELGRVVPVHYQEPFRRGFGKWNPKAEDFVADLRAAIASGAAGWCFHNGDRRDAPDGQPRRSFDLHEKRLFDQLDEEERRTVELLKAVIGDGAVRTGPNFYSTPAVAKANFRAVTLRDGAFAVHSWSRDATKQSEKGTACHTL